MNSDFAEICNRQIGIVPSTNFSRRFIASEVLQTSSFYNSNLILNSFSHDPFNFHFGFNNYITSSFNSPLNFASPVDANADYCKTVES